MGKSSNNFDWFWCELCDRAAIKCEVCGASSCSGGGCDVCFELFEEAIKICRSIPKEGLLVHKDGLQELLDGLKNDNS